MQNVDLRFIAVRDGFEAFDPGELAFIGATAFETIAINNFYGAQCAGDALARVGAVFQADAHVLRAGALLGDGSLDRPGQRNAGRGLGL